MKKKFLAAILATIPLLAGCNKEIAVQKPPLVKIQKIALQNAAQEENYSAVIKRRSIFFCAVNFQMI